MKVKKFKRFTESDYKGIPDWTRRFFQQLNNILEEYGNALSGGLTFGDNLRSESVKIDMRHDVLTPIRLKVLKRNPFGMVLIKTNYFEYPDYTWQMSPDRALVAEVKIKWEDPPDKGVRCTFLFLGGEAADRNA